MTNFEFYKDELARSAIEDSSIAVVKGKPKNCGDTSCEECDFYSGFCSQNAELKRWAESEYREPPVELTPYELHLCKHLVDMYITRDRDDTLCLFSNKPVKDLEKGLWKLSIGNYMSESKNTISKRILADTFQFVKWSDEEPTSIERLLDNYKIYDR